MKRKPTQFLARFDEKILERLRKIAEAQGRTVTDLLREAVAELLEKRERKKPKKEMK